MSFDVNFFIFIKTKVLIQTTLIKYGSLFYKSVIVLLQNTIFQFF